MTRNTMRDTSASTAMVLARLPVSVSNNRENERPKKCSKLRFRLILIGLLFYSVTLFVTEMLMKKNDASRNEILMVWLYETLGFLGLYICSEIPRAARYVCARRPEQQGVFYTQLSDSPTLQLTPLDISNTPASSS